MSYTCYLGDMEVPTPSKLTVKIKGNNKTLVLLDEGEVNFLRSPGLTEITVPLVFPMLGGSRSPAAYLGMLKQLKLEKKTTRFLLVRCSPDGRWLFDTNMAVSVEDYSIVEDASKGLDVAVDVELKQWRDYGTKIFTDMGDIGPGHGVLVEKERDASTAPTAKTYTVKKGDSLWAIAAKYYGKGSECAKIYQANMDKISNPNLIYPGQVLTLP